MSFAAHVRPALRSPLLPLWLVIFLLPLGRTSELGTLLCLLGAILLFARQPRALSTHPGARLLLWLWAAYMAAALLSAPDAVRMGRAWVSTAGYLRYVPLGMYACFALRRWVRLRALLLAVAVVVALWALDAWIQIATGWSLAGRATPERISGIFGAGNLKLGPALAVLSPFVLWAACERWRWKGLALAFVWMLGPILMAGERAAWLMYGLVVLAFVWRESGTIKRFALWAGAALLVAALASVLAWQMSPRFHDRAERTLLVLQGSRADVNTALSGRLEIWRTAWHMYLGHPINGVGVRDFRYAYPDYAPAHDHFVNAEACGPDEGACHPHQIVFEVLTNTGTLGLALWLAAWVLALRRWRGVDALARIRAFPLSVALGVMLFPFNTHLAFYSAWWGLLFWWLLALWCAALYLLPEDTHVA